MRTLAIYGKGGIGKSTISSGISVLLAQRGHRVLHVGCDPKADSTLSLVAPEARRTLMEASFLVDDDEDLHPDLYVVRGRHGIDCVEMGGPQAGMGCSGQAMVRGFELLEEHAVVDPDTYDVALFDVLGDVVCGGFAMPMRSTTPTVVAIVVSEEMMACYAANNIAKACERYAEEGVALAGLILNAKDPTADLEPIERFADALGTRILARLPRDREVGRAELRRQSVVERAPGCAFVDALRALTDTLVAIDPADCPVPTPLDAERIREVMLGPLDRWDVD